MYEQHKSSPTQNSNASGRPLTPMQFALALGYVPHMEDIVDFEAANKRFEFIYSLRSPAQVDIGRRWITQQNLGYLVSVCNNMAEFLWVVERIHMENATISHHPVVTLAR